MIIKKRSIIAGIITVGLLFALYSFWLNKFQFEIFVIILVLGYLLSYKLVDYIADFKTVQGKSRIDILFLVIFLILLFLPMMHIDSSKVSKTENRKLAVKTKLFYKNGKINYNFGKEFNEWYNDRFFTRSFIIKTYSNLRYKMAFQYYEITRGFVNKKNNWMSGHFSNSVPLATKDEKDNMVSNVNKLKEYCKTNNMKLYIIITPTLPDIYSDKLYPHIGKNLGNIKKTLDAINYVKDKTGVEIVYPYEDLKEGRKNNYMFFKSDHHWTDDGAYLGYLKIMKQIKKDYPNVYIAQYHDFDYEYSNLVKVAPYRGLFSGRTYEKLNINAKELLDAKYRYFKYKKSGAVKNLYDGHSKEGYHILRYENQIKAPSMILFGNSFTLNLLPILPASFRIVKCVYAPAGLRKDSLYVKWYEKYTLEDKPEIFVLCLNDIKLLNDLFDKDE